MSFSFSKQLEENTDENRYLHFSVYNDIVSFCQTSSINNNPSRVYSSISNRETKKKRKKNVFFLVNPALRGNTHSDTFELSSFLWIMPICMCTCRCSFNYSTWIKHSQLSLNAFVHLFSLFIFQNEFEVYPSFSWFTSKMRRFFEEDMNINQNAFSFQRRRFVAIWRDFYWISNNFLKEIEE